ncbi:hypothetical protein BP00DRAFT_235383 [Aspergillus indologenus CBS 114.80]|uniref:Uncharacterized protein n=1 Tax=Aspergillus indologenus CBS 114.80 TaxID=1450541 RepID=A0A2V5IFM8_9EURO|nr:hypothetical protein BP00DRAFT_235383 [Aspergillus indologenus CBS 114.80]
MIVIAVDSPHPVGMGMAWALWHVCHLPRASPEAQGCGELSGICGLGFGVRRVYSIHLAPVSGRVQSPSRIDDLFSDMAVSLPARLECNVKLAAREKITCWSFGGALLVVIGGRRGDDCLCCWLSNFVKMSGGDRLLDDLCRFSGSSGLWFVVMLRIEAWEGISWRWLRDDQ